MPKRHADNAAGDWYIDTECMDCSAARTVAPGLIVSKGGQSVFAKQPETPRDDDGLAGSAFVPHRFGKD
jgi:hypothetical protein